MNPEVPAQCTPLRILPKHLDFSQEHFRIGRFKSREDLVASLEAFGMLHPPLLWTQADGTLAILDGFERLHWAKNRGTREVLSLVLPPALSGNELWRIRVQTLLFGLPLNPAQKAQVIHRLSSQFSFEQIHTEFLPLLHVPGRPESLKSWCLLAHQDHEVLGAAAREEISERVALELVHWEPEAMKTMVRVLTELQCSASIQWELVERIKEVAIREALPRARVLENLMSELEVTPQKHPRRKTQALRDILERRRFPRLKEREAHFETLLKKGALPNNLRIYPPPFFEGRNWQMHITFSNREQLVELLSTSTRFALSPLLEEMMNPLASKSTKTQGRS